MINEANKIMSKYPDRIPIIVNKHKKSNGPEIDKKKYLVPKDMKISQFSYVIRKRLEIDCGKAIFLTINNNIPVSSKTVNDIYLENKSSDEFLYIEYSFENTFG